MSSVPTSISTTSSPRVKPVLRHKAKMPTPKGQAKMTLKGRLDCKRNLLMFTRQLHILLASGTPVVPALMSLERQAADPYWKYVAGSVRQQVEEGGSLASAMAVHPDCFDRVYRSLIEAGETAGQLPPMLSRLVKVISCELATRNGVVGAMLYPAILLTVVLVVLVITLTVVVPRFADLNSSTVLIPLALRTT